MELRAELGRDPGLGGIVAACGGCLLQKHRGLPVPLDLTVSDGCILLSAMIALSQVHLEKHYGACPQMQARGLGLTVRAALGSQTDRRPQAQTLTCDLFFPLTNMLVESLSWKARHSTAVVFKS